MKKCCICRDDKPIAAYNANPRKSDGLQSMCRECGKKASRAHYEHNRESHKAVVGVRRRQARQEAQTRILVILNASQCADCGEKDIRVFEFDHVRGEKVANLSKLIGYGARWDKIEAELAKCDVVCANCHRRRTFARSGSYRIVAE